jgi:hypothetical protein
MPVPQQTINLLNLSVPALKRLAKDAGIQVSERKSGLVKWDYVTALGSLPESKLDELAGDWLYAGQTSLTWLVFGEGEPIELAELKRALKERYDTDPFETDIRPEEVTQVPQLVDAKSWTDDKVVFTFAVSRRVAKVIHNFEPQDVYADEFFVAVLRLKRAILEVRASHDRAQKLANTWVPEIAEHLS